MIRLRYAELSDAAYLLSLRNDPLTRQHSRTSIEIPMEAHVTWLTETLKNAQRRLYIALLTHPGGNYDRVGTCRLDYSPGEVEVSLTVDRLWRGKGLARQIIARVAAYADGRADGPLPLVAEVLTTNAPSLLAFIHEGFQPITVEQDEERRWLWLRKERT